VARDELEVRDRVLPVVGYCRFVATMHSAMHAPSKVARDEPFTLSTGAITASNTFLPRLQK
jgi:hypothetical protein